MFEQPFAQGDSFIHKLDPRLKIGLAVAGAICLAALRTPQAALAGLGLALLLLMCSRPPWLVALKRLAVVNLFILFMWLTVPATFGGAALWQWGPLALSRGGVLLMWLVTLKCNALVLWLMVMLGTMPLAVLGAALQHLRFPGKLTFLLVFVYRYVHVAAAEWQTLKQAADLRCFVPRCNMHSYRTLACLLGMTFVRGFDRAGRVYEAMLLRGFAGRFQCLAIFRARRADLLFAAAMALCLAAIILRDLFAG